MDLAVDILKERQQLTADELKKRFKRTKPFRQEPIPKEEMLYKYNQQTPEQMLSYIDTYGAENVDKYIKEMETLKKGGKSNG